ncbi:MAG: bifunctional folylpolyglutamate synthase/dihydrofolate synthase [Prevotella sp.]|jgi:dihydrofolate synthase/folylpolyglutamate synthase|nr:folylpolyglutamate synthase/dihydrofolate synthase family protein [uncultured Prevotella sp.]MCI1246728.1 bifunctional folylpolyglutamate synthase/dihydrofolate synthase [Prevotella sp.]
MNYQETVQYLFKSTPVFEKVGAPAYKAGLENSLALDEHFGHPHTHYLTIHIAGTNGKGSCSHTLAAILQADGYKVGLYTSPHLVDFRERIRVNGKPVSEKYVVDFVEQNRSFFEPLHPSFFELTTAMAFKYFADQKVDIAVIEVGLGGRLDCTNIITPILSIITNISFDHMQFLGHTLPKIAGEKAGIIKNGVPVVIGETVPETRVVFESKAEEMQAQAVYAEDIPAILSSKASPDGGRIYKTRYFGVIKSELGGIYQDKNTNTILTAAIQLVNRNIIRNVDSVAQGFAHVCEMTGLRGRWERLKEAPLVICDTGHNVGGWQYLSKQIATQDCKHRRIVFGMVNDKDLNTVMGMLPEDGIYYWTQPSCERAFPVKTIADTAKKHHLSGRTFPTVAEAYHQALEEADPDDFIFVGGSSYIVADLLRSLE